VADNIVKTPLVRQAFQLARTGVCEFEAGTRDQILHRLRDIDFARGCYCRYACSDVQGDAMELIMTNFALSGVKSDTAGYPECG
jgi:hypothetical protein